MSQATLHTAEPPYTPDLDPVPDAVEPMRPEEREVVPEYVSDKVRPDIVAGLLKEYTKKLRTLTRRASKLPSAAHKSAPGILARAIAGPMVPPPDLSRVTMARDARRLLVQMMPAATELARLASAQIEHTRIRPFERVELMLRAAEFEVALESASETLKPLPR